MKDKFIIVTGIETGNKYGIKVTNICDFVYYTEKQYTEIKVIETKLDGSAKVGRYEIKETAKEKIESLLDEKSFVEVESLHNRGIVAGYGTINEYKGKMNASDPDHADRLMRTQFLKYFSEVH